MIFAALVGCEHHWTAPGLEGVVVDEVGAPLADVEVVRRPTGEVPEVVARTGPDGTFHVAPGERWRMLVPLADYAYLGEQCFRAEGRSEVCREYGLITGDPLQREAPVEPELRVTLLAR